MLTMGAVIFTLLYFQYVGVLGYRLAWAELPRNHVSVPTRRNILSQIAQTLNIIRFNSLVLDFGAHPASY